MLSLTSHPAAGPRRAPPACAYNGDRPVFLAKSREPSRGRRRTPCNGLKDRENLPLAPFFAGMHFFAPVDGTASQEFPSLGLRISRMIRE